MAMSKKHYEAVAKILTDSFETFRMYAADKRNVPVWAAKKEFAVLVIKLADLFASDNRNFNRAAFYEAVATIEDVK